MVVHRGNSLTGGNAKRFQRFLLVIGKRFERIRQKNDEI